MTTTTPIQSPEAALTRAVECWNAGDLDGYLEVYAQDVRLHGFTPEPMDKGEARAFYEGMFAAFPDNRLDLHDTFGSGNRLTTRFTLTGRHDGTFMGVPATGTRSRYTVSRSCTSVTTPASSAGRPPTTWASLCRSEPSCRRHDRTRGASSGVDHGW